MLELRMLREILSPVARKRLLGLLLMSLLSGLSNLVGVGSVVPFMALASNPDLVHENPALHFLYQAVGAPGERPFLLLLGCGVSLAIALANGLTALSTWSALRFSSTANHELSTRLLRTYLARPYVWFLDRSSSELGKNILGEVNQAVDGFVQPLANCIVQGVTATLLLTMMIVVDPLVAAMTALMLGGAYSVVYWGMRGKLQSYGRIRVRVETARFRSAGEALQGVREIKLAQCRQAFASQYSKAAQDAFDIKARAEAMAMLPKPVMETTAFGGIVAIIIYLLANHGNIDKALPLLSLYALCGLRLLPALQQIYHTVTKMRFNAFALHRLYADLTAFPEPQLDQPDAGPRHTLAQSITFQDVAYCFPGGEEPVLQGVSLSIPRNSMVAFVGGTGAGKTTLVNLLLGLLMPTAGAVLVDGQPLDDNSINSWQRTIGYVPQDIFILDKSVSENVAFGIPATELDEARVERAARIANIHDFVTTELPNGYETVVGERGVRLSGGQRQRLGIARALYRDPDVLILDEATSALDGTTEAAVIDAIRRLSGSRTIIQIAHRLTTIRECECIYLLEHGRITDAGTYEELLIKNPTFRNFAKAGDLIGFRSNQEVD